LVKLEADYKIPIEVHNPMELHGITAHWTGDQQLMIYAKTQGVNATQQAMAQAFKIDPKNIRVHTEFMGGGFGMGLRTWPQETAVVAIAKKVGRPVKLVMNRSQMFTMVGHRPYTVQTIQMGADKDGKLVAINHAATAETASYEDFTEATVNMTRFMYACPNVSTRYRLVRLDRSVPIWMRGPGEATGAFALESAMDEMAYKLNLDPIEFRLLNYTETDPEHDRPYSSKHLKEAYERGAEAIGWKNRKSQPGTVKEDNWLVGYGMSTGVFNAFRWEASARAILNADGSLVIQSAVTDIGPGTGTALTMIAHNVLGVPFERIKVEYGDTSLPKAPTQGGSAIVSAVGSAVFDACSKIKNELFALALKAGAPLAGLQPAELTLAGGVVTVERDPGKKVAVNTLMESNQLAKIEKDADSKGSPDLDKYSMYSFSVHFVKVRVNPLTGSRAGCQSSERGRFRTHHQS
jgi:xanthine dehydrogenase YagR molybdenum-binding subunit